MTTPWLQSKAQQREPKIFQTTNLPKYKNATLAFLPELLWCPPFWPGRPSHQPSSSPAVFGVPNNMASCSPTLHPGISTGSSGQSVLAHSAAFPQRFALKNTKIGVFLAGEENLTVSREAVLSARSTRTILHVLQPGSGPGAAVGGTDPDPSMETRLRPQGRGLKAEGPESPLTCFLCEAWLRTFQVKSVVKLEGSYFRSSYKYSSSLKAQIYSLYFHIHCNCLEVS